eukprot:m.264391 g.264391  ORF g.264391 m.264391 type:complete len:50 (+) comp26723_c0_seq1:3210-3359(+)
MACATPRDDGAHVYTRNVHAMVGAVRIQVKLDLVHAVVASLPEDVPISR